MKDRRKDRGKDRDLGKDRGKDRGKDQVLGKDRGLGKKNTARCRWSRLGSSCLPDGLLRSGQNWHICSTWFGDFGREGTKVRG